MTKEQEILTFLHQKVFDPILNSPTASKELKSGVNITIARMQRLPANKIVQFYWSAVSGTDQSISFSKRMKEEGFTRFEDILEEFRVRFDDKWLRKK